MNSFSKLILVLIFFVITTLSITVKASDQNPPFEVKVYNKAKAYQGTTFVNNNFDLSHPKITEIDMLGNVVWEHNIPQNLARYTNPGFDVEKLSNGNILFVLPGNGVYEINKQGKTVWSHIDAKISHDADRLANGNTIYVYGNNDQLNDAQVKEITPDGKLVWSWSAKKEFNKPPYNQNHNQGWTHTNSVTRLNNGNTLISPRNFGCLVEVDAKGKVAKIIGKDFLKDQHDPEVLANGHILVANHDDPHEIVEIDPETDKIVWRFPIKKRKIWPVRDADKLPNGNILITSTAALIEITPNKEVVWLLRVKNPGFRSHKEAPGKGFYKAQRVSK